MIEIALLIFGIRALSQGKFHLTTRRVVRGSLGQLLAILACAPMPLAFVIGFAYGYRYGYGQLTQNDSLRSTLIAIESGIVATVLVLVYLIGWPFSELIGQDPTKAPASPMNPIAKKVLIVIGIGTFGLFAVTVARVYFPEFRSALAMWPTSMESAEEDIDAIPPEPPRAGPVPAILLAETSRPMLERMQKFNRRTLLEYYDYVGNRSPDWDEHVHKAMELTVRNFCDMTYAKTDHEPIHAATTKAIEAGCDDPLLLYLHYRYASPKMGDNEREAGLLNAAKGLRSSTYPYFRRTGAIQHAEQLKLKRVADPRVKAELKKLVTDRLDLIVLSAGGDERCEDLGGIWFDNARQAYDAYVSLGYGPQMSWELVDATLSRDTNLQATRYFLQGWFYLHWYQRQLATIRSQETLKLPEAKLIHGRSYLESSFQNVPHFASANEMLRWEVMKPRARGEMEKWFTATMEHRPRLPACQMKLDWLTGQKKTNEVLEFGRACRDSKNWECGIPLAVVHAHQLIANNERSESARASYFRNRDVAADILYVYAKTLEAHPDNVEIRSRYAYYCYRCGHYRRAHRQFEILGDKLWFDSQFEPMVKDAREQVEKLVSK